MSQPSILLLDNQDSFTYNLVHYLEEAGSSVLVAEAGSREPDLSEFDAFVISPGPGSPAEAHSSHRLLDAVPASKPVLGVCLGMQVMVEALGGEVGAADRPHHGVVSKVAHDGSGVFTGLPHPLRSTRYHSLTTLDSGPVLAECAWAEDGSVQGVRHPELPWHGVQFHPESVMTTGGRDLLRNFVAMAR